MPLLPPSARVRTVALRVVAVGVVLDLLYVATKVDPFALAGTGLIFAGVAAIIWSDALVIRETWADRRSRSGDS